MITHNEALIGDCDRILHIRDGVLTEENTMKSRNAGKNCCFL